ncbi:MAG: PQQ-dependent sugar dehydrogenase [Gammaproteobacteria bacterium]|nr:PQQ-dependent sugar dehydrogenase [Gammaproteobacteria bacterium]
MPSCSRAHSQGFSFVAQSIVALCLLTGAPSWGETAPQIVPALSYLLDDSVGLTARVPNTSCIAPEKGNPATDVALVDAFPSLPGFTQPTKVLQSPGDDDRWFVLEKAGQIRVFENNPQVSEHSLWLDLSSQVVSLGEGGLLGMAFDPNWPQVKDVYLSYTGNPATPLTSYVSRFRIDDSTLPVSFTEEVILTVDQELRNHNGGDIAFGPDGMLFIGLGDGGGAGDPQTRAQDPTRLLGSFLRIGVLGIAWPSPGYVIPASNHWAGNPKCGPAANSQACPEIFAWGFRNPWRWSFDSETGHLWAGDVGQLTQEEVNIVENSGNYGWDCREGELAYEPENCTAQSSLAEPVTVYPRELGQSVTGGYVYRGSAIADLAGRYVFGDFVSGRIWALRHDGAGGYENEELVDTNANIVAFAEDRSGELYAVYFFGRIMKLVAAGPPTVDQVPDTLSASGCFKPSDPSKPLPSLIGYDVNASFWSDGADKHRYLAIPDGSSIAVAPDDKWIFPVGSVIAKHFRLAGKLIETRLLMHHPGGTWGGYTYEWNDDQSEATRVLGGKVKLTAGQTWIYPSENACFACHTSAAGTVLGLESNQLKRRFLYPTGHMSDQIATLTHIDILTPITAPVDPLPSPVDLQHPIGSRARAYLHTNCSQCHRPGGPTPAAIDLRYTTSFGDTQTCDELPLNGDLGIPNARVIAPGNPDASVLLARMSRRDALGMPPLASSIVDSDGAALIREWISSLQTCQ